MSPKLLLKDLMSDAACAVKLGPGVMLCNIAQ